ncbi:TraR/DksA family transcriptional regulator [Streptomyces tendae]|uniref:TraR/DksA family transcriptional regulator n=1 Tax=Streptomyces tendae TaxID=1932 RepID=UPI00381F5A3B
MVAKKKTTAAKRSTAAPSAAVPDPEEKAAAEKGPAKRTPAKKPAAKKAAGKKTAAEKTAASGGTAKKSTAKKSTAKKSTAKKVGAAEAAEQTGATTVVAKKTPGTATAAKTAVPKARGTAADPGDLAVRPGEEPWTPQEVEEARGELQSEADRLRTEIDTSERSLQGMMRDSGDGAGDDEADTGSKNITREHELALAATAREVLTQTERALDRLDAGTYGLCENCGKPIGKARMQAFPRATLCVECKQKQERRY